MMNIALRIFLYLLMAGILSACGGGGGGGNAGIGGSDSMMDFPDETSTPLPDETTTPLSEETPTPLLAENGQEFKPTSGGLMGESDIATMESARDALAELGALRAARPDSPSHSPSFYEQMQKGVRVTGNAGDYELVVREKNYRHSIGEQQYERALESFFTYSYLVIAWGDYNPISDGDEEPSQTILSSWVPSYIGAAPVPNQGTATYGLEGRAEFIRADRNVADSDSDYAQIIMTGELTADFGEGTVGGYLESDYGYEVTEVPGSGLRDYIPKDITAAKHLGNDRTNTPSELNGSVRLDFLEGKLAGFDELYREHRWGTLTVLHFNDENCGIRACFGADVNIYPGMATGDFAGLANVPLNKFIADRVGHENGNIWGWAAGVFVGPSEQELFGHFELANRFSDDGYDVPFNRLHGFFVGEKQQPEQD